MPYLGPKIAEHIHTEAGFIAGHQLAEDAGKHWERVTTQNTPIETGNLRTSWYRVPPQGADRTRRYGYPAYRVNVRTDVDYAPYVEYDTRPHEIRPRRASALRFRARDGTIVYTQLVHHPGTKGQHMLAIGEHMTDVQEDVWAEDGLLLFRQLVEERFARG